MVLRIALIGLGLLLIPCMGKAQHTVHHISFPSTHTAPPLTLPANWKGYGDMYQRMGASLPERSVVNAGLLVAQQQSMLSAKAAHGFSQTMHLWYDRVEQNAALQNVGSVLPYNLSLSKQTHGHAVVMVPKTKSTLPPIVFLHGFGGNFQVYAQWFTTYFPDRLVVLPSHGINWQHGSQDYLNEVYAALKDKRGIVLDRPWLLAMSAGGPAGFNIYDRHHGRYRGLIAIATSPRTPRKASQAKDLTVGVVSGRQDVRFRLSLVKTRLWTWRKAAIYEHKILEADHYFMLNAADDTAAWMRLFMAQAEGKS